MADQQRVNEIRELQGALREELHGHPDVHATGIGYRERNGERTDELCLVLTVQKKVPEANLGASRILPKELRYFSKIRDREIVVRVDVQESGVAVPYQCGTCDTDLEARVRPVPGGYSISGMGTGTLGGWVWDCINDNVVLISNNHVLGGVVGTDVLQPGAADGGVPADRIADVVRTGTLDATIAAPVDADDVELAIECIGPAVYEITEPQLDMQVEKVGQTTSLTCGTITQISIDRGHYGSTNDFRVDTDDPAVRFAFFGDSGSLIVERNHPEGANWKRVVGLLWGGIPAEFNAFAHPIGDVFADLDLKTVCSGMFEQFLDNLSRSNNSDFAGKRQRRRSKSFARALENRVLQTERGQKAGKLLHEHRHQAAELLLDSDGRRAATVAARAIFDGKVTTSEILKHRLTKADARNLARVLEVARERHGGMKTAVKFAEKLLERAEGRSLESLLKKR